MVQAIDYCPGSFLKAFSPLKLMEILVGVFYLVFLDGLLETNRCSAIGQPYSDDNTLSSLVCGGGGTILRVLLLNIYFESFKWKPVAH